MSAILPISVAIPVAITIDLPLPPVIVVPIYTMFCFAPNSEFVFLAATAFLLTGADSPVSNDSSTSMFKHSISIASAGTLSPASSNIKSSGTISFANMIMFFPSLTTCASGAVSSLSASIDFSVLYSCINPIIPFKIIIAVIVIASAFSPIKLDKTVAPNNTQIIKSLNWLKNINTGELFFFSFKVFNPYFCSLKSASLAVSPFALIFKL